MSDKEWDERYSFEGPLVFDRQGRPRNPRGRTGMIGRGLLGKWGPNHAADPIVTRFDPARPKKLQMVAIRRRDNGVWAIPGGMVDAGETVSQTVKREFMEEATSTERFSKLELERNKRLLEDLFASGQVVYRGYVDDPRNTDHAWMETTAFHFHCNAECARILKLEAGDDAAAVMWLDVDSEDTLREPLRVAQGDGRYGQARDAQRARAVEGGNGESESRIEEELQEAE